MGVFMKKMIWIDLFLVGSALIILNLASQMPAFADRYVTLVFPFFVHTLGRINSQIPFSVGECLLYLAVVLLILAIPALIRVVFFRKRYSEKIFKADGIYLHSILFIISAVSLWMVCTCFVLYHTSGFAKENHLTSQKIDAQTRAEILVTFRNDLVQKANELAKDMPRDQNDYVILPDDVENRAILSMKQLGTRYERLSGYYPDPKTFLNDVFFSQQMMLGYYYPFSMEANYNPLMYSVNMPAAICHELSHIKGYIYEDEANFISYLACTEDEDPFFQYSGYLSVLPYVERDVNALCQNGLCAKEDLTVCDPIVKADTRFLTKEAWEHVEKHKLLSTEMLKTASNTFIDSTLKANGVQSGIVSYSKVVELIIQYEYQKRNEENEGYDSCVSG